jgi:hypothetical protein
MKIGQVKKTGNKLIDAVRDFSIAGEKWVKARDIAKYYGEVFSNDFRREMRHCAEDSDGLIISNNEGYCLTENASVAEIDAFLKRYTSMYKRIQQRIRSVKSEVWHLGTKQKANL